MADANGGGDNTQTNEKLRKREADKLWAWLIEHPAIRKVAEENKEEVGEAAKWFLAYRLAESMRETYNGRDWAQLVQDGLPALEPVEELAAMIESCEDEAGDGKGMEEVKKELEEELERWGR